MSFKKSLLYFYSLLLIYSCGGGGGGGGSDSIPAQAAPPPNPAPTVALSISLAQVEINENALITYSTTNASSCEASGAWSGSKGTSGSEQFNSLEAGSFTFILLCTGSGGTAEASITLQVEKYPDGINLRGSSLIFSESKNIEVAINNSGRILAISRTDNLNRIVIQVYEWDIDKWIQKGPDIGDDLNDSAECSYQQCTISNLNISGDGLKVAFNYSGPESSYYETPSAAFEWDGVSWNQITQLPSFSYISGDFKTLVNSQPEGMEGGNFGTGYVEVFKQNDQMEWIIQGEKIYLVLPDCDYEGPPYFGRCAGEGLQFGYKTALSSDGNSIVVSAPNARTSNPDSCDQKSMPTTITNGVTGNTWISSYCVSGAISTFDFQDGAWKQRGDNIFGILWGGRFGSNVSISGDGNRVIANGTRNLITLRDWQGSEILGGQSRRRGTDVVNTSVANMIMSKNGTKAYFANQDNANSEPSNGNVGIFDLESFKFIADIKGDDANKDLGTTIATNTSGRILATSGRDFVNVYTVVFE
jgi:hypothetical protein